MEEKDNDIIIKSGNGNKSIGSYVDKICKELIDKLRIKFIAYDNNMNKLITIEQIIKRALNENNDKDDIDLKINYEIGKNKNIPYIKCTININNNDINNLKKLILNKKNKRNNHPFTKNENKDKMDIDDIDNKNKKPKKENTEKTEEDKINELCIENIDEFF